MMRSLEVGPHRNNYLICATVAFLCLNIIPTAPCLGFQATNFSERYTRPIGEMKAVLLHWLVEGQYEIEGVHDGGSIIRFNGVRGSDKWEIRLAPYSALATEMRFSYSGEERVGKTMAKGMHAYVTSYIDGALVTASNRESAIPSAVQAKAKFVVCINAKGAGGEIQVSGCIITKQGLILSTAHDLNDGDRINLTMNNGDRRPGKIVKIDRGLDLALIQMQAQVDHFVPVKKPRSPLDIGDRLYSIGCTIGLLDTIQSGYVSAPMRQSMGQPLLQVDMKIYMGSSGSPVFDQQGNIVAVVKGKYRGASSIGFLIPIGIAADFIEAQRVQ